MRAYVITKYGAIGDSVKKIEVQPSIPGPKEVAVSLKAAALNPIDLAIIKGALKRINPYRLPHRIGFDGAGVITAVGRDVSGFAAGDEVFLRASRHATGTFADEICVEADFVARKPNSVGFEEAASFPLVALTTMQGLVDRAHAKAGQRILIQAGSGGVGTFAIQFAKHLGLHVTTTTSSKNADLVTELGADEVIAYDKEDYRKRGRVYDIVLDTLGQQSTLDAFDVCKRGGVVVSIAGPPDREFPDQVGASLLLRLIMRFISRKVFAAARKNDVRYFRFLTESQGQQLKQIAGIVDAGGIRPVIDRTFSFEQLPEALNYLSKGRARGKVVLSIS